MLNSLLRWHNNNNEWALNSWCYYFQSIPWNTMGVKRLLEEKQLKIINSKYDT